MGWGTEAQGANSLPQSFCGGAGRLGHWMSGLQGRQVSTDWLAARSWPLVVLLGHQGRQGCQPHWSTCEGHLPGGGWEGCERAPWLCVTEISLSQLNIWMFLFKDKSEFSVLFLSLLKASFNYFKRCQGHMPTMQRPGILSHLPLGNFISIFIFFLCFFPHVINY